MVLFLYCFEEKLFSTTVFVVHFFITIVGPERSKVYNFVTVRISVRYPCAGTLYCAAVLSVCVIWL